MKKLFNLFVPKNYYCWIFSFVLVPVLFSCQEDIPETSDTKQHSLVNLLNIWYSINEEDGGLTLSNFGAATPENEYEESYTASAAFYNDRENIIKVGSVSFGPFTLDIPNEDNIYELSSRELGSLFGREVHFEVEESGAALKSNSTTSSQGVSLYIPQTLKVNSPVYNASTAFSNQKVQLSQNIKWNADPQNSEGVLIVLDFDRTHPHQPMPLPYRSLSRTNYEIVTDDGGHTVTSTLLQDIPKDAFVQLYVVRGAYSTINTSSGERYNVIAYTAKIYQGFKQ